VVQLDRAIGAYGQGFDLETSNHACGLQALTLRCLRRHPLADSAAPGCSDETLLLLAGAVRDAASRALERGEGTPAAAVALSLAELELLVGDPGEVRRFYRLALARGLRAQILLPFPEQEFIERSVLSCCQGEEWRHRYHSVAEQLKAEEEVVPLRILAKALGPAPAGMGPYERCHIWLLNSALVCGLDRVRFVTLWDGSGSDGPGGSAQMADEITRRHGQVVQIDLNAISSRALS
jgi:hypothetical protein